MIQRVTTQIEGIRLVGIEDHTGRETLDGDTGIANTECYFAVFEIDGNRYKCDLNSLGEFNHSINEAMGSVCRLKKERYYVNKSNEELAKLESESPLIEGDSNA